MTSRLLHVIILALRLVSEATNVVCNSRGKRKVNGKSEEGCGGMFCLPFGRGWGRVKLGLSA